MPLWRGGKRTRKNCWGSERRGPSSRQAPSPRGAAMPPAQLACVSVSVLNNAATLRLGLMLDDMRVLVLGALSDAGAASAEVLAS